LVSAGLAWHQWLPKCRPMALLLNGRLFKLARAAAEYRVALGVADRVEEPSPPAPYGHRNDQIHLFDEFGLYLIEHHATRLVGSVVFVLWLEESPFKPAREFTGSLTIGGVSVRPGMLVKEFSGNTVLFEGPVLGLWSAKYMAFGLAFALRRAAKEMDVVASGSDL